ncbi:extensin-like domain-containing protein [Tabrizicola sp.]|uniref:extensin-like domain-containing protein n=1 Tax=Tabrizicola sp. TaxID=2005166 RepID=UPI003F29FC27
MILALLLCLAQAAWAQEIDSSVRPPTNPRLVGPVVVAEPQPAVVADAALATKAAVLPEGAMESSLRPERRPKRLAERIAALKSTSNAPGLDLSGQPPGDDIDLAAVPPPSKKEERKKKREKASMKGSVCGVAAIKGEEISRIKSKVKGCGVEDPVAVTSVAGVRLSQAATVDCSIAKALNSWVDEVAQPAFDGKLVEMQVAAHYICRSRNNIKGAKISEHGKGRAIDISAFILSNGKVLTVQNNYNKLLRRIYKAACGYFKTTLGPGSDGYHEDHFHFDTSARKGGAYCR